MHIGQPIYAVAGTVWSRVGLHWSMSPGPSPGKHGRSDPERPLEDRHEASAGFSPASAYGCATATQPCTTGRHGSARPGLQRHRFGIKKSIWARGGPTTGTRVENRQELVARHDDGPGQRLGKDGWALSVALTVSEAVHLEWLVLLLWLLWLAVLLMLLQKLALACAQLSKPARRDCGRPHAIADWVGATVELRPSGMLVRTMSRYALVRAAEAGALATRPAQWQRPVQCLRGP